MIRREDLLTPKNVSDMQAHALRDYPNEACGIITPDGYLPMENLAEDKEVGGIFDQDIINQYREAGELIALFHSHTSTPKSGAVFGPSEGDMISQRCMAIPFLLTWTNGDICSEVVAWGDELERHPLIGRPFQHGITDCYELIRDYYFVEYGAELLQFPRDWEWWLNGKTLYEDGFPKANFRRISAEEAKKGDVVLFHVASDVPNHGGIIYRQGLLLHHASSKKAYDPSRLSKTTSLGPWLKFNPIWLRYNEND